MNESRYPSVRFGWMLAGLILFLALITVSVEMVGIYEDEGIYEATAQSLVEGRGYRIQTLPANPPNAKYPFLYSGWLAALKILLPKASFWTNALLKLSNIPFLLLLVWGFYRTLRDQFGWSIPSCQFATLLLGVSSSLLPFSIVIMTEIPFTLVVWVFLRQMLLIDPSECPRRRWWLIFLLGILIVYLRTAGIAVLAAALLTLMGRRSWKKTAFLFVGWTAAALPWILWSRHAISEFSRQQPLFSKLLAYYVSYNYHFNALIQTAQENGLWAAAHFLARIAGKNIVNFLEGLGAIFFPMGQVYAGWFIPTPAIVRAFCVVVGIAVFWLAVWGYRQSQLRRKTVLGLAAVLYVCLFIVWPWPFAARFLTPIVPILFCFIGENIRRWPSDLHRLPVVLFAITFFLQGLIPLTLVEGGTLWTRFVFPSPSPYQDAFHWMQAHASKKDIVFSGFDSQWVARELKQPVVRLNTVFTPKIGLQLQFGIESNDNLSVELCKGLEEYQRAMMKQKPGQILVFADLSLGQQSWQSLENPVPNCNFSLLWDKKGQPVKIFKFSTPSTP